MGDKKNDKKNDKSNTPSLTKGKFRRRSLSNGRTANNSASNSPEVATGHGMHLEPPDFWQCVSQLHLSYIDVSGKSSISQSPQPRTTNTSRDIISDCNEVPGFTANGGLRRSSLAIDRPASINSFHSSRLPSVGRLTSTASLSRPCLSDSIFFDSGSLLTPSQSPSSLIKDSVVETDGSRSATIKIHKRLSFGNILDTKTNIYTPESDDFPVLGNDSNSHHHKSNWDTKYSTRPRKHRNERQQQTFRQRQKSFDAGTGENIFYMDKDLRYFFQHPWPRLFITYFVIFCNFLIFAEDPISHSRTESNIPVVGNVFSFVVTKYPPEWHWKTIKILFWLFSILCGMVTGKIFIHGFVFGKIWRLKMFRDDQGSWMTMFLSVIVSLYFFSHAYNAVLAIFYCHLCEYRIDSYMGVTNASVMKAAACGTWLGDLVTALMVTDMMLQDNLYPNWATRFRRLWRRSNIPRILIFWVGSSVATAVVVTLIVSDWISWDKLNRDFVATTELSRAFLASFILVMDLLIVMQDWDFPHFTTTLHVNLPGFSVAQFHWKYADFFVSGKWFNYGIILMVMILDLNMWKNQIFYYPADHGQYTGPDDKIWMIQIPELLHIDNRTLWNWEERSTINPNTSRPYHDEDMQMNSRYMGYPMYTKLTAFIPNVLAFILFFALIVTYGRFPPDKEVRLRKRNEERRSSWRRERGHHHLHHLSSTAHMLPVTPPSTPAANFPPVDLLNCTDHSDYFEKVIVPKQEKDDDAL